MDFPSLLGSAVASETGVQKYNKFYYLQVFSKLFFQKKSRITIIHYISIKK